MDLELFVHKIKQALEGFYPGKVEKFCNNLQKYNSYLSGGSLSSILLDLEVRDLDIYIPMIDGNLTSDERNYKRQAACDFSPRGEKEFSGYQWDQLGLGNIYADLYKINIDDEKSIDLILCQKDPSKCKDYFDLTCCQLLFDGKKIHNTEIIPSILRKEAYLTKNFSSALYESRERTISRIIKYMKRGFIISIKDYIAFPDEIKKIPSIIYLLEHIGIKESDILGSSYINGLFRTDISLYYKKDLSLNYPLNNLPSEYKEEEYYGSLECNSAYESTSKEHFIHVYGFKPYEKKRITYFIKDSEKQSEDTFNRI